MSSTKEGFSRVELFDELRDRLGMSDALDIWEIAASLTNLNSSVPTPAALKWAERKHAKNDQEFQRGPGTLSQVWEDGDQ